MKRIIALLFTISLFCALLVSCKNKEPEITEVRIAYFPNITHAQALVMKSEGLFEEKLSSDLDVKWIPFNAGPSEIEALFAGEIDIGYIGPVPAINGFVQSNGDLHIIAGATNGGSVLVARADVEVNTVADLDGKVIAVPQFGNTQHLNLLGLLTAYNLKPKANGGTVEVVQASNADIANLMERRNIDAAFVPEPWGSILEINYGAKLVLDYDEVDVNGIPSTALVIVRKDFSDSYPDIVKKFIETHKEVTLYIENNDVTAIINTQIYEVTGNEIAPEILESAFARLVITYEIPKASIMDFAAISQQEQFIFRLPDDNIFNDKYID